MNTKYLIILLRIIHMMFIVLRKLFITLWFWLGVIISLIFASLIALLYVNELDKESAIYIFDVLIMKFLYNWMTIPRIWVVKVQYPTTFKLMHMKKHNPFIIASNHISIIDTIILSQMIKIPKVYIHSTYIKHIWWLAWVFKVAQYIPNNKKVLSNCKYNLKHKYSVLVYPEGIYSNEINPRKLRNLQINAFKLSAEMKIRVMPIALEGTGFAFMYGIVDISLINISILKPIQRYNNYQKIATKFADSINKTLEIKYTE